MRNPRSLNNFDRRKSHVNIISRDDATWKQSSIQANTKCEKSDIANDAKETG